MRLELCAIEGGRDRQKCTSENHPLSAPRWVHFHEPARTQLSAAAIRADGKASRTSACSWAESERETARGSDQPVARSRPGFRACLKIPMGPVFMEMAGGQGATNEHSLRSATEEQRSPDSHFHENPPGGGAFALCLRWLSPYSPARGCADFAASADDKIPRRRTHCNFQTGSKSERGFEPSRQRELPG